ncbi:hypothetical protein VPUCM_1668 [Vibrio parahaemolyticus UCM-V493]|nr:hypothetical protein VPUCM_1668 [Vibrio parahaemolyticus UCM-V493]
MRTDVVVLMGLKTLQQIRRKPLKIQRFQANQTFLKFLSILLLSAIYGL